MSEQEDENMGDSKNDSSVKTLNSESDIKYKIKSRVRKRKRLDNSSSSEDDSILPENALEMEKNLHASAIKNNLDDVSVRKILKKVVTNDHVLALVKLREEEEESSTEENIRPKLTRAKVKELMKVSPQSSRWKLENLELTPIKHIPIKTRPEVKALIAQELHDDEEDDEYKPTHEDVQSDDDHTLESCSDIDSLPRTPATPGRSNVTSPRVVKDGPFKVPQDLATPTRKRLNLDEDATIALRTRSKLSLSATPIEHIESSFVPPDDVPTVDVDDPVWNEFLEECLNPASTSHGKNEDDDEADPEYNVAADPDANDDDEEALENSIIKISKKELNDLVTELFSVMPMVEDELVANVDNNVLNANNCTGNTVIWEGKQEPMSDEETPDVQDANKETRNSGTYFTIGKNEPEDTPTNQMDTLYMDTTADINVEDPLIIKTNNEEEVPQQQENIVPLGVINGPIPLALIVPRSCLTVHVEERRANRCAESPPPPPPQVLTMIQHKQSVVLVQLDTTPSFLPEQILILQQQIRQHIQLAASNFLQLFVHPRHWPYGPKYKEYVETLNNLADTNPKSVINVCNLKPALELITTWETTVSRPTPENEEMVAFIQKQIERNRIRSAQNSMYVGDFHDTFKDVVANSSVFLYPYLLPAMPYRPDSMRRFKFIHPEDQLIALGLDIFWEFVEMNPDMYPRRSKATGHSGLKAALKLLCNHMMPWCTPHSLLAHVHYVRRTDKDNPIYKFFASRKVEPVKHVLLPYNPKMTLYEQPEYEMPRIWIRHLAKTSKRFRNYLYRRTHTTGVAPRGIDIGLGKKMTLKGKKPLPINFTKVVSKAKPYLYPKIAPKPSVDKHDIYIEKTSSNTTIQSATFAMNPYDITATVNSVAPSPIPSSREMNTQPKISIDNKNVICAKELTEDVNRLHGIENRNVTIDRLETDKGTNDGSHSQAQNLTNPNNPKDNVYEMKAGHCTCCVLLKKICKDRQTLITEYFHPRPYNVTNTCPCKSIERPKITNKLRLLLKFYKSRSMYVHKDMKLELAQCNENKADFEYANLPTGVVTELDDVGDSSDFAFVTSFELKLLLRMALLRNPFTKKNMYVLMSNFDHETDDPVNLAIAMEKLFDVELVDIFKEFLRFLTPEQADKINKFKEYFTQACASNLVKRISEEVTDKRKKHALLSRLIMSFTDNKSTACETCSDLLKHMDDHRDLAKYTFNLFPHRQTIQTNDTCRVDEQTNAHNNESNMQGVESEHEEGALMICEETRNMTECDDTDQSSDNDEKDQEKEDSEEMTTDNARDTKCEVAELTGVSNDEQYQQDSSSSNEKSAKENNIDIELVMSDSDSVKSECPEWQRSEDKLILEVLKNSLTQEERKNISISDILEEKEILEMITDSLPHKSVKDITDRVMYLLELLVLSENN